MQIGEELCDCYLKGDYQYVLAVHSDRQHIHTHIIFNNTNLYNGLSFTSEHNQGKKTERAWAELRQLSDEICTEHGISVISEPEKGHGVSHFERDMQKEGKSWKEKLRVRIAEVMLYSHDFKDFLEKCSECGIEYVYKPSNKVKLKFRLSGDGQQKFTRADTLGADFTLERITEQIAEIQEKLSAANVTPDMLIEAPKPVAVPKPEPKQTQAVTAPTKPKQSAEPETITETSETAKRKAAAEQVEKFFAARRARRQAQLDMLNALNAKIKSIEKLINMMIQHSQNYATYKEYQERSAFTQKSFRKKNAAAIDAFEEADKYIAEHIKPYYIKGKPPKLSDLQAMSAKLKKKYNALVPEHNAFLRRKAAASQYSRQVRKYLDDQRQQERNRQYQERKRSQQKKKDYLE